VSDAAIQEVFVLYKQGRPQEALVRLEETLSQQPGHATALNARSMILDGLGHHEEALRDVQAALAIRPDFADALTNRGIHHARVGEFEAALSCYDRSLALEPSQRHAVYNRATARLAVGDWLRGFRDFEHRWSLFPHEAARLDRLGTRWLGERDVSGKTVLLHHEQGYGDTLQFCRYAILVMRLGARVIVAAPAALRKILATLPGKPVIVTEGAPVPEHDYCCSLMSLPHVFSTTPNTVPAEIPYLHAEAEAVLEWRNKLGPPSRKRIGLVWTGRRYPPINHPRDLSLEIVRPLLDLDADFVSLQTDLTEDERRVLGAAPNVIRYGDVFEDFADTAALIENLDLVITVDTAVAHLAGALGKPAWIMNRYASCWRWLQKRRDSPWYPSVRLFRQPAAGQWPPVVQEIVKEASQWIAATESTLARLNRSLTDHHGGRLERAIEGYRQVLRSDPLQPEALHFLSVAEAQSGRHEAALASIGLVLRLQPDNATAFNHQGNILVGLDRHTEALMSYNRAIELDPTLVDAFYNRGGAFMTLGQHEQAVRSYESALALDPTHARAHNNLGNVRYDLGQFSEALAHHDQATRLDANFVDGWVNAANSLRRLGRYDEALERSARALERSPDHAEANSCHGATLAAIGRETEALQYYQRALALQPTLAEATWNEALALLSRGNFREGWPRYESRWKVKSLNLTRYGGDRAAWFGQESLQDKVILLHAEQGYGDSIQFCRYAPLVAKRGARVVLGVPSALRTLMSTLEGVEVVVAQVPIPQCDFHCPLLSLPLALGTELQTIPDAVPYLRADIANQAIWSKRLGPRVAPRIGLAWSGRPTHTNDANRSIPLHELLPLTQCDVECVSLQKEIRDTDLAAFNALPTLHRAGEALVDFADAAALVAELDLVITVDTALAHLAGALGKPVWILLPYVADWRWLQERDDSPWYPTAKLFRQPAPKDWGSVIERVRSDLRHWAQRYSVSVTTPRISPDTLDTPRTNPGSPVLRRSREPETLHSFPS
jgi:tetratricopeptide (TPR) repeat protein